jgi:hypothetical protein
MKTLNTKLARGLCRFTFAMQKGQTSIPSRKGSRDEVVNKFL